MKLRPEFEVAHATLLNLSPILSLDVCLGELLREERLLLNQDCFSCLRCTNKRKGRNMEQVQCFSCNQFGYIARNCNKKFCHYCKEHGHIITDCPTRPQ